MATLPEDKNYNTPRPLYWTINLRIFHPSPIPFTCIPSIPLCNRRKKNSDRVTRRENLADPQLLPLQALESQVGALYLPTPTPRCPLPPS